MVGMHQLDCTGLHGNAHAQNALHGGKAAVCTLCIDLLCQCRQTQASDSAWPTICKHAWTFTYLQIAKMFILARIDLPSLKSLPGTDAAKLPDTSVLTGSNIYSIPESILLAWMEVHLAKVFPGSPRRLSNFDADIMVRSAWSCCVFLFYRIAPWANQRCLLAKQCLLAQTSQRGSIRLWLHLQCIL